MDYIGLLLLKRIRPDLDDNSINNDEDDNNKMMYGRGMIGEL